MVVGREGEKAGEESRDLEEEMGEMRAIQYRWIFGGRLLEVVLVRLFWASLAVAVAVDELRKRGFTSVYLEEKGDPDWALVVRGRV
jgi:hypothetical protein